MIASTCFLEAISGTTPPYFRWTSICEAMTFDNMTRPSRTTEAAVSSQDDSIPNTNMDNFPIFLFYKNPNCVYRNGAGL